ncbi:sigma-70 family RNA polymerase sigma factor [Paenibacillus riograndensis]|uniref:DNA-directed RNA polymerase subunit sigma n=1 Tax=Paenibacillus riograndensis SBR5 TaxID=1073571 RepID=A0A0E3WIG3_9BACL|nr:sigma-70 family RNA polymerase sigma factor [Paenibacillus riograndensis]CQR56988.1 DNA-directed RNA polymerase subunit sigma [Paenibacillus riograndensis SBR5]
MRQWVEKARQGDAEAFAQLMAHCRGMAYAVSYDMLKDVHLAEDAVQEAFLEAYLNLQKLSEPAAFPGWFRTIVVRQCQRTLRRKRHPLLPLDEALQGLQNEPGAADILERKEAEQVLQSSVAALSAKLRVPVQLFYFYGYSLQEISGYLGTPVQTLKKRLHDARQKLKGTLPVADLASVFNLLYEGGGKMLHIVNGDVVGNMLKHGIVQGEVLVWREIYSSGPVFADLSGSRERAERARVLEATLGIPAGEYMTSCEEQERKLREYAQYDEVVLWFEHDLFDQSMLAYLLHWFKGQKLGRTKLSLLCIGEFPGIERFHGLGQLTPAQLGTLSGTWRTIGRPEIELGSELWQAYASPDPTRMADLLDQKNAELAASGLPFASEAFRTHLMRLPSVHNGLGIVEQATFDALASGAHTPLELFRQVTDTLHVLGMGDLEYWKVLRALTAGEHPLLHIEGVEGYTDFRQIPEFLNRRVAATALGQQVQEGAADRVLVQGIDEWYGGLHLQGREVPWRWDTEAEQLVPQLNTQ